MTAAGVDELIRELRSLVGRRHVLVGRMTAPYRKGYRTDGGQAIAVVRPGDLVEQWRVLQACVRAGVIVVMQAANTGLTGGSTPAPEGYDRDVVIINTLRLKTLHVIDAGRQVICAPGVTLDALEKALKPWGREPHSVIGSSCIGASVVGGVCNNSGGSLLRRGPAFTRLALYARMAADGSLELVNHLGVRLDGAPAEVLRRLDRGDFDAGDIRPSAAGEASDADYQDHVRDIDADTPARFNADPRRLFEASGSAGRLCLFAVRLDTFAQAGPTQVFYIGVDDPGALSRLRRNMLSRPGELPIAAEYVHREAFDIAARYGKDAFLAVRLLGTHRLPLLFRLKTRIDAMGRWAGLGSALSDHLLQIMSALAPEHLPARMRACRDRFEHHLLLRVPHTEVERTRSCLTQTLTDGGDYFECTPQEAEKAFLHRFAVAGAAVRYRAVHRRRVADILALDVALPRNAADWCDAPADDIDGALIHRLYYGHFFCHVFHQDYIVAAGHDPERLKREILHDLDRRGAEYPAEHNVGHMYKAKPELEAFYRSLDPCNQFNPGIGLTSRNRDWKTCEGTEA
ncbi:D-lactate dehydrogenase [Brevundimonas diminuta]|uniref:D-lactate dehydrogenase n=1 Tax=Brevundimonas diminuta TaxID=293 RepID=UPI0030F649B0